MKITLIGPVYPYRGGIAHFTTMLALKLMEQGHEIQVISFKKQYPKWLYPGKSDKDYGQERKKVEAEFILSPLNPTRWIKTIKAIKAFQPDKVLIEWWVTFWGPALGFIGYKLKKSGSNIQYIIHNTLPHEERWIDKRLARSVLQHGQSFVVMNEKETQRLINLLGQSPRIIQCPLPVFSMFPKLEIKRDKAKEIFNLSREHNIVLFFGIVRPYKGLRNLISTFEILKTRGQNDIGLLVAGEFWEDKHKYLREVDSNSLTDRVWIIDRYISDLETSQLFAAADLFVAPYVKGTQSASIKTALNFGIPMVITNCVSDELTRGLAQYCRIINESSPEDLADAILSMIDQPRIPKKQVDIIEKTSWNQLMTIVTKGDE